MSNPTGKTGTSKQLAVAGRKGKRKSPWRFGFAWSKRKLPTPDWVK